MYVISIKYVIRDNFTPILLPLSRVPSYIIHIRSLKSSYLSLSCYRKLSLQNLEGVLKTL